MGSASLPKISMADVFISYSRRDKAFVQTLNQALEESKYDTWIDWQDIPLTADWWEEIKSGIEAAHTFIFVISPDSVSSNVCHQEIDHAVLHQKRLMPVICRDGFEQQAVHEQIRKINWLFFRETDDFEAAFQSLTQSLNLNLDHVKTHTRLLVKAVEWDKKSRDPSFLLQGTDLKAAAEWLMVAEAYQPWPTPLHNQYILESEKAEIQRQQAELKRQRWTTVVIGLALLITSGLGIYSYTLYRRSQVLLEGQVNALAQSAIALHEADHNFDALLAAIKAGVPLMQRRWRGNPETQQQVIRALQTSLADVSEQNRLAGHEDIVYNVSFSPVRGAASEGKGQLIATASKDGTAKLWTATGQAIATLDQHPGKKVYDVAFSPDGQIVATASEDGIARLWDRDGQLVVSFKNSDSEPQRLYAPKPQKLYAIGFGPDGQIIGTGSADGFVKLWRRDGTFIRKILAHDSPVDYFTFSPDGSALATVSRDHLAKLWSLDGTLLATLKGHTDNLSSVSFSPDGQLIATASLDDTVRLWQRDGKPLAVFTGHGDTVWSVRFSPDGRTILSGSDDGTARLWSLHGQVLQILYGHSDSIWGVAFSADGMAMATASADKTVKLWRYQPPNTVTLRSPQAVAMQAVSYRPGSDQIAVAGNDGTVQIWTVKGQLVRTWQSHQEQLKTLAFSPDGQVLATAGTDGTVKLWLPEAGVRRLTLAGPSRDTINDLRFSPDGQTLAIASDDHSVRLWPLANSVVTTLEGHSDRVRAVSFNPIDQTLASASDDKTVKFWSQTGKKLPAITGHNFFITSVNFSPDGQRVVTASDDKTAKIWTVSGELIAVLEGHTGAVTSASFSADGRWLATASDDQTIRLWTADGQYLRTLFGHSDLISRLQFAPTGLQLASASKDGSVILWNLDSQVLEQTSIDDPSLPSLMTRGCSWMQDYLATNPAVAEGERTLCSGVF